MAARWALGLLAAFGLCAPTRADAAAFSAYSDLASWQAAAGPARTLDFEDDRVLSPSENYGALGAIFSLLGPTDTLVQSGGELVATDEGLFGFGPAAVQVDFTTPVRAIAAQSGGPPGTCFGGCPIYIDNTYSWFRVYDEQGEALPGPLPDIYGDPTRFLLLGDFFGIVSDVPIGSIRLYGEGTYRVGPSRTRLADFRFAPVPEPASVALFGGGTAGLAAAARRRSA